MFIVIEWFATEGNVSRVGGKIVARAAFIGGSDNCGTGTMHPPEYLDNLTVQTAEAD